VQKYVPSAASVTNLFRPSQRKFDLERADSSQPARSSRRLSRTYLPKPQPSHLCAHCERCQRVSASRAKKAMSTFGIRLCLRPAGNITKRLYRGCSHQAYTHTPGLQLALLGVSTFVLMALVLPVAQPPTTTVVRMVSALSMLHTQWLSPAMYVQIVHSFCHLWSCMSTHLANVCPSRPQH